MTVLHDFSEPSSAALEEPVAGTFATALGFSRWRPLRCPECGHVMHADSELAGTCPMCPGLVPLARA